MIGAGAGGTLVENDDFRLTLASLDHIPYNHVQRCTPTRDPEDVIDTILETVGEREAVWSITSASGPPDLVGRLTARGCARYSLLSGMALDLTEPIPAADLPPGVRVEEVGPELLETWADLVLDQWHLSARDRRALLTMHREFGFERVRRWLCFLDDVPAAKASVAIHEPGCAGIYGVGTRPAAQGRGLASGLMVEVLRALQAARVRTVVLQSTPPAVGLYRRLGFAQHCTIPVYTVPNAAPPRGRLART